MGKNVKALSIKQKIDILNKIKENPKVKKELCQEYKCNISTINRIVKNENKIREIVKQNKNIQTKRLRKGKYENVENALAKWFDQQRLKGAVISSPVLFNKAKEFAIQLNSGFEPTNGWLWRWKRRENITFKKLCGSSNESDHSGAENYIRTVLPKILENYSSHDIFNADETALFFKALPHGSLARKGTSSSGHKVEKSRITLLFVCNATGDYKKAFSIGKSKNPRCFKNKNIPLRYYSNKNAWMTCSIWNRILADIDEEMIQSNRKIVLFVDNASCHKVTIKPQNINVQFLPANTTPLIQPLDLGIIHSFKAQYRQIIIRKQLLALESGLTLPEFAKNVTILNALHYVKRAWWMVRKETIDNCFKKAGFIQSTNQKDMETDPEILEEITDLNMSQTDFENYVACDENVECYGLLTDAEIVQQVLQEEKENETDNDNSGSDEDYPQESEKVPTIKEVTAAINILQKFALSKNTGMEEIENLEEKIFKNVIKNMTQTKITNFFSEIM